MVALQRWSSKTFLRKVFIESFNKFLAGLFGHADAGDNVAFGCAAVDGDSTVAGANDGAQVGLAVTGAVKAREDGGCSVSVMDGDIAEIREAGGGGVGLHVC